MEFTELKLHPITKTITTFFPFFFLTEKNQCLQRRWTEFFFTSGIFLLTESALGTSSGHIFHPPLNFITSWSWGAKTGILFKVREVKLKEEVKNVRNRTGGQACRVGAGCLEILIKNTPLSVKIIFNVRVRHISVEERKETISYGVTHIAKEPRSNSCRILAKFPLEQLLSLGTTSTDEDLNWV